MNFCNVWFKFLYFCSRICGCLAIWFLWFRLPVDCAIWSDDYCFPSFACFRRVFPTFIPTCCLMKGTISHVSERVNDWRIFKAYTITNQRLHRACNRSPDKLFVEISFLQSNNLIHFAFSDKKMFESRTNQNTQLALTMLILGSAPISLLW